MATSIKSPDPKKPSPKNIAKETSTSRTAKTKKTTPKSIESLAAELLAASDGDIEKIISTLRLAASQQKKSQAKKREYGEVVVAVSALTKTYKIGRQKIEALRGVDLQVRAGEYISLTGPSGSGKSTLLQLIGALDKPTGGSIVIDGSNVSGLRDRKLSELRNKTIGFVFQFFYLQPFLRLSTNLEVPGMFARTSRAVRKTKAAELAEKVGLQDRMRHLPKELSGGQMQRAAIARALLNNPKILLADEPTGNLDRENAYAIMDLFEAIRDVYGTTIIMVTHDPELATRADREVRMLDGKVVLQ